MSVSSWSALVGIAATLCTTLCFVPQLLRLRRDGGRDLSWTMLSMFLAGMALWLFYGLLNGAGAVAFASAVSVMLVTAIAVAKFRTARPAPERRRWRIAIDMDEVMADALGEHLRRYNAAFGAALSAGDLTGRHLEECIPPAHRDATEALLDASFFADLAVLPDCQDVILALCEHHDVFIASAAMDVPCSFEAKYQWLRRHFPFIPPSQIVFCGDKQIVDADYLIDDRARHFERFKGGPVLFSAPHNASETRYPRVNSWREVRMLFLPDDAPRPGLEKGQAFAVRRASEETP